MSRLKQVAADRSLSTDLVSLVETYQEVAVLQMQRIRTSVLQAREYHEGLLGVFGDIRYSQQKQVEKLLKRSRNRLPLSLNLVGNGKKRVTVLFSPSAHFSGAIGQEVFHDFKTWYEQNAGDVVIFGETGRILFEKYFGLSRKFEYIAIGERDQDISLLVEKMQHFLNRYDRIDIFSGEFVNLAKQIPKRKNLAGESSLLAEGTFKTLDEDFLYEPKLEEIVSFFEAQVLTAVLRQLAHESHLAHLGSRIMTLESTLTSLQKEQRHLRLLEQKLERATSNRRQRQRLAGISLWSN